MSKSEPVGGNVQTNRVSQIIKKAKEKSDLQPCLSKIESWHRNYGANLQRNQEIS